MNAAVREWIEVLLVWLQGQPIQAIFVIACMFAAAGIVAPFWRRS